MVLKEPHQFTVFELKAKLQELGLASNGTKVELITRLQEADPEGNWRREEKETDPELHQEQNNLDVTNLQRQVELLNMERDLMRRELVLVQRELELVRAGSADNNSRGAGGGNGSQQKIFVSFLNC